MGVDNRRHKALFRVFLRPIQSEFVFSFAYWAKLKFVLMNLLLVYRKNSLITDLNDLVHISFKVTRIFKSRLS